ncbi:hypothetical protein VIGAN_11066700 [Vigna angularis var. angularis]|uniref:COBRA C-terminal domain-containing protein n=1 Tax=Vigna angularis var. angularis TaxID=157739 RepID=A0A0S3T863_PHAAN|nr:hypothetical protein VIGAN_11066700 [Vigna angularis var. angularis]
MLLNPKENPIFWFPSSLDKDTFTFKQGWAFPRKIYFNGDECMMPPPDTYPFLPNSAPPSLITFPPSIFLLLFFLAVW